MKNGLKLHQEIQPGEVELEGDGVLSAISQWVYTLNNSLPQGLGTGSLFSNNLDKSLKSVFCTMIKTITGI